MKYIYIHHIGGKTHIHLHSELIPQVKALGYMEHRFSFTKAKPLTECIAELKRITRDIRSY